MSRRGFLKNFGLLGVVVAGASTALANNDPIVIPQPIPKPEQPKDFAQAMTLDSNGNLGIGNTPSTWPSVDYSHLAPSDSVSGIISLHSDNRSREEKEAEYNNSRTHGVIFVTNDFKGTNEVHMAVGKDNRLWIKVDNEWKRVALDA